MSHSHSMGGGAKGTMTAYLHLKAGDTLWFEGWVPGRSITLFGACVALLMLGIGERWLAAVRAAVERAISSQTEPRADKGIEFSLFEEVFFLRRATPFVLRHAWARGVLRMMQATLGFLFMLAVMTYQVAFIISIVIGVGLGEMMYGRYADAAYAAMNC